MEGWIKIHRKMLDWEWYSDTNTTRLFLHLLLNANIKPTRFCGHEVPKGALVTSQEALSLQTGLSRQCIRTALKHLENTGEINQRTNQQFTIITICKWETYQCIDEVPNQQVNQRLTNDQPTTNQRLTIEEEYKNIRNKESKNNNKIFIPPTIIEVETYSNEIGYNIDGSCFVNSYEQKGWMVGKNKMKDWKAAVRNWKINGWGKKDKAATGSSALYRNAEVGSYSESKF